MSAALGQQKSGHGRVKVYILRAHAGHADKGGSNLYSLKVAEQFSSALQDAKRLIRAIDYQPKPSAALSPPPGASGIVQHWSD